MIVLPIQRRSGIRSVPAGTLALALASTVLFVVHASSDRGAQSAAAAFYVDSGLAAIELPRYRDHLQQSADTDAIGRLAELERVAGPTIGRPADPTGVIALVRSDRRFETDLRAGKVVTPSDPEYADWQRDRSHFDQMMDSALEQRLALSGRAWSEPWRLVTYLFLHPDAPLWLTNLLVLLLIGPFAEAAAGTGLFLLCYLGGGAFAGVVNLLLANRAAVGDWASLAALAGLLAAAFGIQMMPGRLAWNRRSVEVPGLAALMIVIGIEAMRWFLKGRDAADASADLAGMAFGAGLAGLFKVRESGRLQQPRPGAALRNTTEPGSSTESALARQAREAATRLETRRAKELYKELVELEPQRIEHLCGYLNVALMGPDETTLQDAALRLLWLRTKSRSDQLRKAFLMLLQPKVLKVLPIDEHLRLARRLVKLHEDAAALRVLDAILSDAHLRQLYGRQLADCLLGLYTGYTRRRLTTLAEGIQLRLTTYFDTSGELGGLAPATHAPTTLYTGSPRSRLPPRS